MQGKNSSLSGFALGVIVGVLIGILGFSLLPSDERPAPLVEEASTGRAIPATTPDEEIALVDAASAESAPRSAAAAAERSEVEAGKAADADLGVVVYGRLTDQNGAPVDGASVGFKPAVGQAYVYAQAENGGYSLTGLQPGRWQVSLRGSGYIDHKEEVEVGSQATQRLDLTMRRAHAVLVKMVTPEGVPLPKAITESKLGWRLNVIAVATREAPSGQLPMTDLRSHARFGIGKWQDIRGIGANKLDNEVPETAIGTLQLDIPPPVYVSAVLRHRILRTVRIEAGQDEVTLTVSLDDVRAQTATLRVQVVDADTMAPIEGARVALNDRQSGGGGIPTDADGVIVLENQPSGLLELDIAAKDRERYHQNIRVEPGETDLGMILLSKPVKVVVRVLDAAGQPQTANVIWQNLDRRTFPQPLRTGRSTQGEGDGKYELWGVGRGRYLVQARVKGKGVVTTEIDTNKVSEEAIELVLVPSETVRIDALQLPAGKIYTVTILDQRRLPVYGRYFRIPYEHSTELAVGRYTYELHDGTTLVKSGRLVVRKGADNGFVVR